MKSKQIFTGLFLVILNLSNALYANKARIQEHWQQHMLEKFKKSSFKNALILVSYSGFVNNGQSLLLYKGSKKPEFWHAKHNKSKLSLKKIFSSSQLASKLSNLPELMEFKDLQKQIFDGTQYEFLIVTKRKMVPFIEKRIFMNNPNAKDAHWAIIHLFELLKKAP